MKRFIFTLSVLTLFLVGCSDLSNTTELEYSTCELADSVWVSTYGDVILIKDNVLHWVTTTYWDESSQSFISLNPPCPDSGNLEQYLDWYEDFSGNHTGGVLVHNSDMVTSGEFETDTLLVGNKVGTKIDLTAKQHNTYSLQKGSDKHESPCKVPIFMFGTETECYFIQWYSQQYACSTSKSHIGHDEVAKGISFEIAAPFTRKY